MSREVVQCCFGCVRVAAEDEEPEGAVEGDFVFQVDDVGVEDAGYGRRGEDAAGDAFIARGVEE